MRFEEAVAELEARQPEHMPEPDLERIRALAGMLDDPQRTYPTIHVTGTNGKTTTARLAAALACEQGITTGLFTSPHLSSVTERLVVCGEPMRDGEFGAEYERLLPYLRLVDERVGAVTYFEALRRSRTCGSRTSPSAWRCSRWAWGGRGTRRTSSRATWR